MIKQKIYSLQVFRGFAALSVAIFHSALYLNQYHQNIPDSVYQFFRFGQFGVDFFFVLSGFIIFYAHFETSKGFNPAKKYLLKRLIRIFPAYLPISICLLLLASYSQAMVSDYSVWSSLLLIPDDKKPILGVAWTLIHEMIFYLIFLLFFFSKRFFYFFLIIWTISNITLNGNFQESGLGYYFNILNIEFLLGILCAWIFLNAKLNKNKGLFFTICGVILFIFSYCLFVNQEEYFHNLYLAFGFALIILGFVILENTTSLNFSKLLIELGNSSYSLYLIHTPLISLFMKSGFMSNYFEHYYITIFLLTTFSVIFGFFYYSFWEMPSLEFLRAKMRQYFRTYN